MLITFRPYASARVSFISKSLRLHASSTFTCGEYPCAGGGHGFYDLPRVLKERVSRNLKYFRGLKEVCSLFVVVVVAVAVAIAIAVTVVQIKAIKTQKSRKRQGAPQTSLSV